MIREILVYPAFNARYYSLYLHGLRSIFGRHHIRYTARGFPTFGPDCLALRVLGDDPKRIYIHSNDMPEMDATGLGWCDTFGKVNLADEFVPEEYKSKVVALGPTFAVQIWGPLISEARAVSNYLASKGAAGSSSVHLANYRGQYKSRFPEAAYRPGEPLQDYIFFNAALWEREPEANAARARFMDAASDLPGIEFEGGLTPRNSARGDRNYAAPGYEKYTSRRYSPGEYLERTQQSMVAFNNPAYRDCHSWRLAEYLAMGKAIISTPIIRALPAPLIHGIDIHYVDGSVDSIRKAIRAIADDPSYGKTLETNARAYYERYLAPPQVIRRLFAEAGLHL